MKQKLTTYSILAFVSATIWAVLGVSQTAYAATFTVTNTNDTGAGSLRQAITDANATVGSHAITFSILGAGPHVITPATALPSLGFGAGTTPRSIMIDGCSQPGSVCESFPLTLKIQINGVNASTSTTGIFGINKTDGGMTIRGLSLTNSQGWAIAANRTAYNGQFWNPDNFVAEYNYIGLKPDGTAAPNANGIRLIGAVGGTQGGDGDRVSNNVIGANTGAALITNGAASVFTAIQPMDNLIIENNIVGLDPTGTQARTNGNGVNVSGTNGAIVRNNQIVGSTGYGLDVRAQSMNLLIENNTIQSNGTNGISFAKGTIANPTFVGPVTLYGNTVTANAQTGILATDAPGITIGGTGTGQANNISNNGNTGVLMTGALTNSGSIRGNTMSSNNGAGVSISGASTIQVTNNNINSTVDAGVVLNSATNLTLNGNSIQNNGIGIRGQTVTSSTMRANTIANNALGGILLDTNTNNVTIGNFVGQENHIHDNGGPGIAVGGNNTDTTASVRIRMNTIYNNAGLGIDLGSNGVTPNDSGDGDTGPNKLINFPVIQSVARGSVKVKGTYTGTASQGFILDFYLNSSPDASGYGEGQTYIGSTTVTTDILGQATYGLTFPGTIPPVGVVSVTATDFSGNTSEFSRSAYVNPIANDSNSTTTSGQTTTFNVLDNDETESPGFDLSSVRLIDPASNNEVKDLVVDGQGTWHVNTDGTIAFTALASFIGITSPVNYVVTDVSGMKSEPAALSVTVNAPSAASTSNTGGGLANTGQNILVLSSLAGVLLLAGVGVLFRKRIIKLRKLKFKNEKKGRDRIYYLETMMQHETKQTNRQFKLNSRNTLIYSAFRHFLLYALNGNLKAFAPKCIALRLIANSYNSLARHDALKQCLLNILLQPWCILDSPQELAQLRIGIRRQLI
ncbi:MAG TPA: right-handed parallel beta-helix repeat-containing protein [Verrucomicrobiae bacterium]|nr:right-handed parallel beta-helix repeat-containing protein [Verrucomicrobiae bacterium]